MRRIIAGLATTAIALSSLLGSSSAALAAGQSDAADRGTVSSVVATNPVIAASADGDSNEVGAVLGLSDDAKARWIRDAPGSAVLRSTADDSILRTIALPANADWTVYSPSADEFYVGDWQDGPVVRVFSGDGTPVGLFPTVRATHVIVDELRGTALLLAYNSASVAYVDLRERRELGYRSSLDGDSITAMAFDERRNHVYLGDTHNRITVRDVATGSVQRVGYVFDGFRGLTYDSAHHRLWLPRVSAPTAVIDAESFDEVGLVPGSINDIDVDTFAGLVHLTSGHVGLRTFDGGTLALERTVPLETYLAFADIDPRTGAADLTLHAPDLSITEMTVPALPMRFDDIAPTQQFADEIEWLSARRVTSGWLEADSTRSYRPLDTVRRDAMAAFLYRLAGRPSFAPPRVSPFADVSTTDAFYREITWLRAQGITSGWPDGTYRPNESISREAMAAFLYRFAGQPAYEADQEFRDVPSRAPFFREVGWLGSTGVSHGWASPVGLPEYRPLSLITRDAMAAFLKRFSDLSES